ncbi:protein glxC [Scytonema millei]|uniref:Protein glxC n=1 Tax=Scytonema millei VB511283 TaxID=1245923 RepID=A0A9X5EA61_9CYAN|nr:protein glxC [Scytonema millei]NHC38062.1 protein glxC [Scytonema millei VB511283]
MDSLTASSTTTDSITFDLAQTSLREINHYLHHNLARGEKKIHILNPDGAHNIAVGLNAPVDVEILGHAGYYAASMNQLANVAIAGNVGTGVAENMMSGRVHVKGFASVSAGASAHGGLLIIDGDASLRCGISLKGADIVVGGSVGSFAAFMAQAGRIVVCGNAGEALGDSLYEAVIYVRGEIKSLGADAQIESMSEADYATVAELLAKAGFSYNPQDFKRVASAKQLYHWNADAVAGG